MPALLRYTWSLSTVSSMRGLPLGRASVSDAKLSSTSAGGYKRHCGIGGTDSAMRKSLYVQARGAARCQGRTDLESLRSSSRRPATFLVSLPGDVVADTGKEEALLS